MASHATIPSWINANLFEKVLHDTLEGFKEIRNFKVFKALATGENFATLMLKVQVEVGLFDNSCKTQTFMVKVQPGPEKSEYLSRIFKIEESMYREVVPELEELYNRKGLAIRFGADAFELPVNEDYILLEDLSAKGFRNVKRQECLDMIHTKSVLKKLAQWHAASAVRVADNGPYPEIYQHGLIDDSSIGFEQFMDCMIPFMLATTRQLPNHQEYHGKLESLLSSLKDVIKTQVIDETHECEFKVLNHGDLWCNNIMFQHDNYGNPKETRFVDFQYPRYGSVTQDLLFFILSSTQLDFKVACFDEMICYYYEHLVESLKLLEYAKPLPRLRDIHIALMKISIWSFASICCTMTCVLCDPTDIAIAGNFFDTSEESEKFKNMLFSNERYIKHLEVILPWLYRRGAFEM